MRQKLIILITVVLVLGALVALNAASYVRVEKTEDAEWNPDRSTYNSGQTGTRALYDFLSESGYQVMRWREAPVALLGSHQTRPRTFVVIGRTSSSFDEGEAVSLLRWVEQGGRLVIIDRRPDARLLAPSGDWRLTTELLQNPSTDPQDDNPEALTANVKPARAAQPTLLTYDVESVMPSRLAAVIKLSYNPARQKKNGAGGGDSETGQEMEEDEEDAPEDEPPPPPARTQAPPAQIKPQPVPKNESKSSASAPVVHLQGENGALLVDYPHGDGRIIVLSDPFIVANNGISRADNLRLALNLLGGTSGGAGLIAFDEFHQGRSVARNELLAYFAGTPLVPMLLQGGLIVLALLWTGGRRFARPLPLPRVDRRSKLEFVASMAELQQQARAYDLAIENVYARLRRVLARYAGVDHNSPRSVIAAGVAARSSLDQKWLEALMRDCENAINGEPINAQRSLALVARLREVERTLGLRMRSREIRQAREM